MSDSRKVKMESLIAQACHYIDPHSGGISPPIQFASTYARDREYEFVGDYSYSRSNNPGWEVVERVCAELDGGVEA